VTALTLGAIGTILLLYVIVLKRKGWLTEESRAETSYLCPNPQCKKIFQEPIKLTDLSQSPPRVYLACPHCGLDMEKIPAVTSEKSKMEDQNIEQTKPEIHELPNPEPAGQDHVGVKPKPPEDHLPKGATSPQASPQPKPSSQTPPKTVEARKKSDEKRPSDIPRACSHHFGYVKTLPKNASIPDECLWCPWIVECLAGAKVEA
jgi:DNA-directed RNA polymerase subunit RPC12/RpoP